MSAYAIYPELKDRSVLITGGGSGIGAALAEGFCAQGAKVAFIDINADASTALADAIAAAHGNRPHFIAADLRDVAAIKAACSEAQERHGPVTVLVNNAAWDDRHEVDAVDEDYWEKNSAINLRHQFFTIQSVAEGMKAAGGGAIINFTSTSYMLNIGDMPVYTTSKAGIVGLTKGMAGKLGPHGIRVNAIAPGWVMTERQKQLWVTPEALDTMIARQCLKHALQPEEMVGPALFLASRAAGAITGHVLIADGGML